MKNTAKAISLILALSVFLGACQHKAQDVDTSTVSTTTTVTEATTTTSSTTAKALSTTTKAPSTTAKTPLTTAKAPSTTRRRTTTTTKKRTTTTAAKPVTYTVTSGNGVNITAEYINQNGFPTGCESASATMLLRFWGVDITIAEFVDNYLDRGDINYYSSGTYAPHPADKFVGDPRSQYSYGCYAPVIVRAINKCLPTSKRVINETGTSLPQLCKTYIDEGMQVMIWATIGMTPVQKGGSYIVETTGKVFEWPAGEHCLLLVGYDSQNYYLLDPYKNRGLVSFPRKTVEARYAELGCQAVGILSAPTTSESSTTTASTEPSQSGTTSTDSAADTTSSTSESTAATSTIPIQ